MSRKKRGAMKWIDERGVAEENRENGDHRDTRCSTGNQKRKAKNEARSVSKVMMRAKGMNEGTAMKKNERGKATAE